MGREGGREDLEGPSCSWVEPRRDDASHQKPDQGLVDQCPQLSQRLTLQGIVFSEPLGSPTRPCSVSLRRARQSWADSSRSGKGLQNVTILMD